jgi:hypothetical protein
VSGDLRLHTTLLGVRDERELGSADELRAVLAERFGVSLQRLERRWRPSRSSPRLAEPVASQRCSSCPAAGAAWRTVVRSTAR